MNDFDDPPSPPDANDGIGVAILWIMLLGLVLLALSSCSQRRAFMQTKSPPPCIRAQPKIAEKEETPHEEKVDPVGYVLIEFRASWCGPCQRQAKNIDALIANPGGYNHIYSIDVDENAEAADRAIVNADHPTVQIPCHIVFKDGVEMVRHYGVHTRDEMLTWLDEAKSATAR